MGRPWDGRPNGHPWASETSLSIAHLGRTTESFRASNGATRRPGIGRKHWGWRQGNLLASRQSSCLIFYYMRVFRKLFALSQSLLLLRHPPGRLAGTVRKLPQMIYDMQNFGILFALIETRALTLFSDCSYYMRANGSPFQATSGCKRT